MKKIFYYELKRLLYQRFFLALFLLVLIYSWNVMETEILLGVANTAPFSGWSYGVFAARVAPLLLIGLLFFLTIRHHPQAQKTELLISATPVSPVRLALIRQLALCLGFLLLSGAAITVSWFFYGIYFHFYAFDDLLWPFCVTLLPTAILIWGLGLWVAQIHRGFLFGLMLLLLLWGYLPVPQVFDLYGAGFYWQYPLSVSVVEPAFTPPVSFYSVRSCYVLLGGLFLFQSIKKQ